LPPTRAFFEDLRDALEGFLPREMRALSTRIGARNIKVWLGDGDREHYEVQGLRRGRGWRLEVGWHAEHRDADRNDAALDRLRATEAAWRKALGPKPQAGAFVGPTGRNWRRLSEIWEGPNLWGPEAAVEAAARLAAYIRALETARRGRPS
jgi:hypothetical protein